MRHGLYLPLFGALADPHVAVDVARCAEQSGWDGLFVWDHVLTPVPGEWDIACPWIVMAAAAVVTSRIRLGPMVTPLPRRRVMKLARETVTLDRLSRGRLTLGLGAGGDIGREFSAFADCVDARQRAQVLEEGAAVLVSLWAGESVNHRGAVVAENVRATPGPIQQPRIPVWFGTARTTGGPVERAARYDGVFTLGGTFERSARDDTAIKFGVDPARVARIAETVAGVRGTCDGFDIAVVAGPDDDLDGLRAAGATWAMQAFWPWHRADEVLRVIERGKPG
ncbi:LLM class flavin-dependent oxidoreductase [Mycobacterium decipiens]|uniref:Luciferase n=1 Tax=Mycobacterium decipiens TaxID=1430326 RepID=A0A1X2LSN6_9MYCO|nr:LLM class flavin-dependent oxidoreductase [Mycobacterium decipiens]OSC39762.1 luciferase [Mycobacterium decipiens]